MQYKDKNFLPELQSRGTEREKKTEWKKILGAWLNTNYFSSENMGEVYNQYSV